MKSINCKPNRRSNNQSNAISSFQASQNCWMPMRHQSIWWTLRAILNRLPPLAIVRSELPIWPSPMVLATALPAMADEPMPAVRPAPISLLRRVGTAMWRWNENCSVAPLKSQFNPSRRALIECQPPSQSSAQSGSSGSCHLQWLPRSSNGHSTTG